MGNCRWPIPGTPELTKQPRKRLFRNPLTRHVDQTIDNLCANPSGDRADHENSQLGQWRSYAACNMKMHVQLDARCAKDDALRYENAWEMIVS